MTPAALLDHCRKLDAKLHNMNVEICRTEMGITYRHLRFMLNEIIAGRVKDDKAHRWIGYVHGALAWDSNNYFTLPEILDMIRESMKAYPAHYTVEFTPLPPQAIHPSEVLEDDTGSLNDVKDN